MLTYEESIIIERPVAEVFQYMQDLEREREWQPNLRRAYQDPPGAPHVGTRRRYVSEFMGKEVENVYEYTSYEVNRRVTYRSASESAVQSSGEVRWEPVGDHTRVTMKAEVELGGLYKFLPASLVSSVGSKELRETLQRVKEILERC